MANYNIAPKRSANRETLREAIYNDLLNGARTRDILEKVKYKNYGLDQVWCEREVKVIIKDCKELIEKDFEKSRRYLRSQLFNECQNILDVCKRKEDYKVALQAIDRMARLADLYNSNEVQQNITIASDKIVIDFGFDVEENGKNNDEIEEAEVIDES